MKKLTATGLVSVVIVGLLVAVPMNASAVTVTPAPTDTSTATPAPTDTSTATPAPTDTSTATPAPTDTSTATPAPTDTSTATPAPTDTSTATPAPTDTTPAEPAMNAVTNIQGTANQSNIHVTWDADLNNPGITYVVLAYSNGAYVTAGVTTDHTVDMGGTYANRTYDISISEYRNGVNGPFAQLSIVADYPAVAVANVAGAVNSQRKNNTAHVTWDTLPYYADYTVVLTPSNGDPSLTQTVTGGSADFTLPDTAELTYTAQVITNTTQGNASTTPVQLTGTTIGFQSDPVTNVAVHQLTSDGTNLQITWDRPAYTGGNPTTQTLIYVYDLTTSSYPVNDNNISGTATSYDFTGIANHRYTLAVYVYSQGTASGEASVGAGASYTNYVFVAPDSPVLNSATVAQGTSGDGYSLTATWNPSIITNAPVTGYEVYINGSEGYNSSQSVDANSTSASLNVPTDHTQTYTVTVVADYTDAAGNPAVTAPSNEIVTTPLVGRPSKIDVMASGSDPVSADVYVAIPADDGGSAIRSYTVTLTPTNSTSSTIVQKASPPAEGYYVISGLIPGVTYKVTATATNADGYTSLFYDGGVTTTSLTSAPDTVPNVQASFSNEAFGSYNLSATWDASQTNGFPVATYEVTLFNSNDGSIVDTKTVDGNTLTVDFNLPQDHSTSYYVRVAAVNKDGSSDATLAQSNVATEPIGSPQVVSNLHVEGITSSSANLYWDAPQDNGGAPLAPYYVNVRDSQGNLVQTSRVDVTSYTVQGLNPGQQYSFGVVPVNIFDFVGSEAFIAGTTASTTPGVVENTQLSPQGNSLVATWNAPVSDGGSPITSYTVTLIDSDGHIQTATVRGDANPLSASFLNTVRTGKSYSVTVVASNANGQSVIDNTNTGGTAGYQTSANAPSVPLNVTAVESKNGDVTLTWEKPKSDGGADITGYIAVIGQSQWADTAEVDANTFTYTFKNRITPGGVYFFRVVAVNGAGASIPSAPITVKTAPVKAPTAPTEAQIAAATTTATATVNVSNHTMTMHAGKAHAGDWVYGYVYSKAVGLGWRQLDANGEASWSYQKVNLPNGTHTFVGLNADGKIIAKQHFKVTPVDTVLGGGTGTPLPGTTTGGLTNTNTVANPVVDSAATQSQALAFTGSENVSGMVTFGGLLLLLGLAFTIRRHRKPIKN